MSHIHTIYLSFLIIAGLVSFVLFGIDKYKALKGYRRISEKTLLRSIGVGGFLGGIAGMNVFHHKTIKGTFLWRFWCLVGVWIIISIGVLFA